MEANGNVPVLQARGIHKWFGPLHILKGVDFAVRPGEVVALIGDNGAGKCPSERVQGAGDRDTHPPRQCDFARS